MAVSYERGTPVGSSTHHFGFRHGNLWYDCLQLLLRIPIPLWQIMVFVNPKGGGFQLSTTDLQPLVDPPPQPRPKNNSHEHGQLHHQSKVVRVRKGLSRRGRSHFPLSAEVFGQFRVGNTLRVINTQSRLSQSGLDCLICVLTFLHVQSVSLGR